MRERAEDQGGSLHVLTAPGDGTTVEAHLPVGVGARA
jgi:signal transduction histidine kinase